MATRSSHRAYIENTMYWVQGGHDGVQPPLQMGHDTYLSPISGYIPDGHHRDVTASCDIPVVYVLIEQLQEKIQLIEEELIELRNMRSMNDTSRQCTVSCQNAMSGLQAGSLIIIKNLQHKIQSLEEELRNSRSSGTECTKCGAHMDFIERSQVDTVPNSPREHGPLEHGETSVYDSAEFPLHKRDELPTLNVSQGNEMPVEDSPLQGQVEPYAASGLHRLYEPCIHENPGESLTPTVASTDISESLQQTSHLPHGVHSNEKVCAQCGGAHFIGFCEEFKSLSVDDRWHRARQLRLCFRCLNKAHIGASCKHTWKCGFNGCRLLHSKLLHDEERRKRIRLSRIKGTTSAPSSRGLQSSIDSLDTFLSTELIGRSPEEPSSGETFQPPAPPNGIMRDMKSALAPSKCQFELSNLGPIVPEFPPPPSEDIADRLQERFKGKHRKYWSILLQESERKIH